MVVNMYSLNTSQIRLPVLTAHWLSIRCIFVVSANRSKYRSDRIGLVSKGPVTPHAETTIDSHGDGENLFHNCLLSGGGLKTQKHETTTTAQQTFYTRSIQAGLYHTYRVPVSVPSTMKVRQHCLTT